MGAVSPATAQEQPQTIEEAKEFGFQILTALPSAIQEVWKTQAVPVWQNMWSWIKNIWETQLASWFTELKEQLFGIIGKEIEQKHPLIEEQFEREKQQLKQKLEDKIQRENKTLWNLLKGFFQNNEEG